MPAIPPISPAAAAGEPAAAVAAGMAVAGLGTDTGGSSRIPAALNGIVGFRPTVGRYPADGLTRISSTRDTAGPMGRSVADVALLDAVLAGEEPALTPANLRGLRLGVPREHFYGGLEPLVARRAEALLDRLRAVGAVLVEADIEGVAELNQAVSFPVVLFETGLLVREYVRENLPGGTLEALAGSIASADVRTIFAGIVNGGMPEADYRRAMERDRPRLKAAYAEYFARHRVACARVPHHAAYRPSGERSRRNRGTERRAGSHVRNLYPQHRPRQQRRPSGPVRPPGRGARRNAGGAGDRRARGQRPPAAVDRSGHRSADPRRGDQGVTIMLKYRCFLSALATAALLPGSAQAQVLEEIVITAERRSENLQEVPNAITAPEPHDH